MSTILENANGVIIADEKSNGHHFVSNATCECGCKLYIAPAIFKPDHKKGDPVLV